MTFELVPAVVSGFVATVVMTVMMMAAKAMHMTEMPPMSLITGTMMAGRRGAALAWGVMLHFVVMGAIVFGIGYAWLFTVFDSAEWWVGALVGLVHGLIVGGMAMPMMPAMHPRMERATAHAGATQGQPQTVHEEPDGQLHLSAPGVMGKDWGGMTPAGIIIGHVVYGLVLAVVYSLWVG